MRERGGGERKGKKREREAVRDKGAGREGGRGNALQSGAGTNE